MVTFTSQAAASFALKSFEEKPDIFHLEGKPEKRREEKRSPRSSASEGKPETGAGGRAGLDGVSSQARPVNRQAGADRGAENLHRALPRRGSGRWPSRGLEAAGTGAFSEASRSLPIGPRAGRAGGRGAEGRGEGRGSKGRGRGDGSRPPRSRSEASGDGGGKAAAAK